MDNLEELNNKIEKAENKEAKVKNFADILDNIDSLKDKKKLLWKEIYENALVDRENAGMLFTDIYKEMQGNAMQHTALGPTAAKYLERMCKSNDQILRLAELVAKAEETGNTITPDEIFDKINQS